MKYTVDKWIQAHYTVEVEADSFEDAELMANCGVENKKWK